MTVSLVNRAAAVVACAALVTTAGACGAQQHPGSAAGKGDYAPTDNGPTDMDDKLFNSENYKSPAELYDAATSSAASQGTVRVRMSAMVGRKQSPIWPMETVVGEMRSDKKSGVRADMKVYLYLGPKVGRRFILLDDTVYWRPPPNADGHVRDSWLKMTTEGGTKGRLAVVDNTAPQLTVTTGLAPLRAGNRLQRINREIVNGVNTTHYRITVGTGQAFRSAVDGRWKDQLAQHRREGYEKVIYNVWIDAQGLPRKWTSSIGLASNQHKPSVRIEYDSWGKFVNIEPPPPSKVRPYKAGPVDII